MARVVAAARSEPFAAALDRRLDLIRISGYTNVTRIDVQVGRARIPVPGAPGEGRVELDNLIFWLNNALGASFPIALAAALVWGLVSVLLSPCHLGTIPLVVAIVGSVPADTATHRRRRGAPLALAFAGGMFLAIALLGTVAATAGVALQRFSAITGYVVAAVFLTAGLNLLGLLTLPMPSPNVRYGTRRGILAVALIGFVLGFGLSPCTIAFLAPILGLAFGSAAAGPVRGLGLLLTFGLGHCAVIAMAGSSADLVQGYLNWKGRAKATAVLKTVCGVLLLAAAALLLYRS